jgi:uncharacterized protein YjbJ (UPF0337 family)
MDTTNKKNKESFTLTGDWTKQSAELKKTFSQLTEADLKFETGKEQDLLARIQSRLGKKREEVIELLVGGLAPGTLRIV